VVAKRGEVCEGVVEKKMRFWRLLSILGGLLLLTVLLIRPLLSALFLNAGVASVHRVVLGGAPPEESVRARRYLGLSRDLGETTAALRNEGVLALAQEDYTAAEQALAEAVARSPEDPLVRWYQGQLYLATGRREMAVRAWQLAGASPYFLESAEILFRAWQLDAAREGYELYLEIVPGDAYALRRMGEIFQRNGDLDTAMQYYQESLAADPSQAATYYAVGTVYQRRGELERALESFQEAIALGRGEYDPYIGVGQVYQQMGRYEDAAQWYEHWRQVMPESELPYLYEGISLYQRGYFEEGAAQLLIATQMNEQNCGAFYHYGLALYSAGRLDEALEALERANALTGCNPGALHMNLGVVYEALGRFQDAAVEYRLVVELAPDYAPAREALQRVEEQLQP